MRYVARLILASLSLRGYSIGASSPDAAFPRTSTRPLELSEVSSGVRSEVSSASHALVKFTGDLDFPHPGICLFVAAGDWVAKLACPGVRKLAAASTLALAVLPTAAFPQFLLPPGLSGALFTQSAARKFLRWWACGRACRAAATKACPQGGRDLAFALRVAPVLFRYQLAKERICAKKAVPLEFEACGEGVDDFVFNASERQAMWAEVHAWGAVAARDIVRDLGGFYRKIGQITGTASQMMPPQWVGALAETMDDNPKVPGRVIRRVVEGELRELYGSQVRLEDIFEAIDLDAPVATASIAQVHRATLKPAYAQATEEEGEGQGGCEVAVKVVLPGNKDRVLGDLRSMLRVTRVMEKMGLDGGIDMPTIMEAYYDMVPNEFDLRHEARKIKAFRAALITGEELTAEEQGHPGDERSGAGSLAANVDPGGTKGDVFLNAACAKALTRARRRVLQDSIELPVVVDRLVGEKMLVMGWFDGTSLLDILRDARDARVRTAHLDGTSADAAAAAPPLLPPAAAARFGSSWAKVFHVLHVCWGAQVVALGAFHTDPHPGNIIVLKESGKLAILDWGQTKALDVKQRRLVAKAVVAMHDEDPIGIAKAIEETEEFEVVDPSPALWALFAFNFFDTRWTPIAGVNVYDIDNSLLSTNGFVRNSREAFPLIRVTFLMRGLMDSCRVEGSMVDTWEPFAAALLAGDKRRGGGGPQRRRVPAPLRWAKRLNSRVLTALLRRLPAAFAAAKSSSPSSPSSKAAVANGAAAAPSDTASSGAMVALMQGVMDAQRSGEASKQQRSFLEGQLLN